MELLLNKYEVTDTENGVNLKEAWSGAKKGAEFEIRNIERNRTVKVKVYGGSMATVDEKCALYYLLSDAVDYMSAKAYKGIDDYLVNDLGYDEFIEDAYGYLKKNPELKRVGEGLKAQYNKACTLVGGADKLIDELEAFRKEYDY